MNKTTARLVGLSGTLTAVAGLLLFLSGTMAFGQEPPPRVFLVDGVRLAALREHPDKEMKPALERLRRDAAKAMRLGPFTVTTKKQTPPSGDKHDYMSLSRYWWPDPEKPDGLPYVRRDGEVNPEINEYPDHESLEQLVRCVQTLALSSYLFRSEEHAARAAELLRAWFLSPETRMKPNLDFAQAVPGRAVGRGPGVLDGRGFAQIVDAVGLLQASPVWTAYDQQGLVIWFRQYLKWLEESPNGRAEAAAKNNHGSWYDVQWTSIALFIGDTARARATLEEAREKRIAAGIEPDGRQPEELARTRALSYSLFNLQALAYLASLGRSAGVDLWQYETGDGRSIRKALAWVLPYLKGEQKWTYDQISEVNPAEYCTLLVQAAAGLRDLSVAETAAQLCGDDAAMHRAALVYGYTHSPRAN